jgi:DNA-binding transcriptional MerR regulator
VKNFTIGELAREAGCKVQTIRYYEQIGLLAAARRTAGNQRIFAAADRQRLAFIRHARDLGFPLPAVRELIALGERPEQPCRRVDMIAAAHLRTVEAKIARLGALRAELRRMIGRCAEAGGPRVSDCRIIEALAGRPRRGADGRAAAAPAPGPKGARS